MLKKMQRTTAASRHPSACVRCSWCNTFHPLACRHVQAGSHSGRPGPPSASAASAQTPAAGGIVRVVAVAGDACTRTGCPSATKRQLACTSPSCTSPSCTPCPLFPPTRWMGFSCRSAPLPCRTHRHGTARLLRGAFCGCVCVLFHCSHAGILKEQGRCKQAACLARGPASSPAAPWTRTAPCRRLHTSWRCRERRCGTAGHLHSPGLQGR